MKAGVKYDVVISNPDGSREVGLMLAPDQDRRPYRSRWIPDVDPEPFWLGQESWHQGYGAYYFDPTRPHRYAYGDGVDARFASGLQLSPKVDIIQVGDGSGGNLINNGGFENALGSVWNLRFNSSGRVTNSFRSGAASLYMYAGGGEPPRGRRLTFEFAALKLSSNAAGEGISEGSVLGIKFSSRRLDQRQSRIYDRGAERENFYTGWGSLGRGNVPGTIRVRCELHTDSSYTLASRSRGAVVAGGSGWTENSLLVPVYTHPDAGDNPQHLYLVFSYTTPAGTYSSGYGNQYYSQFRSQMWIDDLSMTPLSVGGESGLLKFYKKHLYLLADAGVYRFDRASRTFRLRKTFVGNNIQITDGTVHGQHLVVGLAAGNTYKYAYWDSDSGNDNWTEKTITWKPDRVDSILDIKSQPRLAITTFPNTIRYSNSDNISNFGSNPKSVVVGDGSEDVTAIHKAFSSVLVGKTDGLYFADVYQNRISDNKEEIFRPLVEARISDDANFGAALQFIDGWFYFAVSSRGLERLRLGPERSVQLDNVSPHFAAPEYRAYGGGVAGLGSDGFYLYALQVYEDDDGSQFLNILSGSHEVTEDGKNLIWHNLETRAFNGPLRAVLYDENEGILIVSGSTNLTIIIIRVPKLSQNPAKARSPQLGPSGTIVTPIFNGRAQGWSGVSKRVGKMEHRIDTTGLSDDTGWSYTAELQVDENIDDDGPWTSVGILTDGTLAEFTAPEDTVGRDIRWRFGITSTNPAETPRLGEFRFSVIPIPDRTRIWEMQAQLGVVQLRNGTWDRTKAEDRIGRMVELLREEGDLRLYTRDGPDEGYKVRIARMGEDPQIDDLPASRGQAAQGAQSLLPLVLAEVE